jgi:glyoxylase-like metal-dependent hydrolase (beta-lactamase superfamily II)
MRAIVAAALLGLVAAVPAAAHGAPEQKLAPFAARELAPGIHLLSLPADYSGPAIGNVIAIEQRDGYVLIDSGATAGHGRIVAGYIRALGAKPVKAEVFTHWHNDHPLGASEIRKAWPRVRVIATAATKAALLSPAVQAAGPRPDDRNDVFIYNQVSASLATIAMRKADPTTTDGQRARYDRMAAALNDFAASYHGTYIVPPTETFTDRLLLDDPERPVELRFLGRANTAGDAVAWLPKQRIVMTGDIVVSPVPFGFFSYPADWLATIEKLKAFPFALLVPGHGEPQTDAAYLDKLAATIRDIRAQVGPLAAQGLSLDDTRKRVDFSGQTAIFGTTPRLKAGFESLWLAPMIENAWREAKGLAIVQGGGETTPASVRRTSPQSADGKAVRSR